MRAIIAVLGLSLTCACAPGPGPDAASPSSGAEITAYCGGGYTGGGEGVTITADDHVVRWRQVTAGAQRSETDLGAKPAFAADIRRRLDAMHFNDMRYEQVGNMTCSLRAGAHSVSWPQAAAGAPAEVLSVHQEMLAADGE